MSAKMTTAQKNTAIKEMATSCLFTTLEGAGAIQYEDFKFAIPLVVGGEDRWAKVEITATNNKDTATTTAFDPYGKAEEWKAKKAEKAELAALKAKEKAAKIAKDKAKRGEGE